MPLKGATVVEALDWKDALEQLFAAILNQEPLEAACGLMASLSVDDESHHKQFLFLFDKAKQLADAKDGLILEYINKSGYKIGSFEEAKEILKEFENIYLLAYFAAKQA
jgi:hypothetical protein